jgi:lysine-specific demethylase 3
MTFLKTGYEIFCRVALEKGKRLDPHDDPIHDQSSYLDGNLRTRLYQEYGVRGSYLYF